MRLKTLFIFFVAIIMFSGCSNTTSAQLNSLETAEASDWWTRPVSFEEFWSIQSDSGYDYKMENLNCSDLQTGKWFGVELSGDSGLCTVAQTDHGEYMVDVSTSGMTPSLTAIDVDAYDLQIDVYQFSNNPNRASTVLRGQSAVDYTEIVGQQFVMSKLNIDGNEFVVIHFTDSTYSRTWNEIEVIGLNKLGMAEVIYAIKGEGMQLKTDDHGLYFTQYQYLKNEPLCCPSFTRIIRLTHSQEGWLESVRVMNTTDADVFLSTLSDLQPVNTWLPSGTIQVSEE
jgi:hypothetical protein